MVTQLGIHLVCLSSRFVGWMWTTWPHIDLSPTLSRTEKVCDGSLSNHVNRHHLVGIVLLAGWRRQQVFVGRSKSDDLQLKFSVQGSLMGDYSEDATDMFQRHEVRHHFFADDVQGF